MSGDDPDFEAWIAADAALARASEAEVAASAALVAAARASAQAAQAYADATKAYADATTEATQAAEAWTAADEAERAAWARIRTPGMSVAEWQKPRQGRPAALDALLSHLTTTEQGETR